jgi:hypothetical protein
MNEENRNAYRLWVGKPEGGSPPGSPRCRWVDFEEVVWGNVDWIGLESSCEFGIEPLGSIKC